MNRKAVVKELADYKYESEYFLERYKNVQEFNSIINKMNDRANILSNGNVSVYAISEGNLKKLQAQQYEEENLLLDLIRKKQIIEERIDGLDQPYKNVLLYRYISLYSFGEIAKKMNYSTKRIYQLHQEGVEAYINKYAK